MKKIIKLIFAILICQLAGIIGSFFTAPSVRTWYQTIQKPTFTPPNWLFAPVWTTLFLLMGISLYLILIRRTNKQVKLGLLFFGIQLLLNIIWSVLFFGLRNPLLGLIEIVILWVFILLTIISFWKIDKRASYLLIPYILWVSFAMLLNFYIWRLNTGLFN
jgi:tryptophan-rich sensory protein